MTTKKNMAGRLGAILLAVLFLVQGIFGGFAAKQVKAQVSAIEVWNENDLMDYEHRFTMKYQQGLTTAEPFGCDNQDVEAFSNHGRSGRNIVTKRMTGNYTSKSTGIRYTNVGRDGNGTEVDFQLSVVSVTNAEPRYDLLSPDKKYKEWKEGTPDDGTGYDWPDGMGQPIVAFSVDTIGMFIYNIGSAKVEFQFFKHNTNEPLTISGHGTLQDIDAGQGIEIGPDSNLDNAYVLEGNDFLEISGTQVQGANGSLDIEDKRGWLNLLYNTDQITFSFLHQSRLDRWDNTRNTNIAKYGSVEGWAQYIRNHYVDQNGNSLCPNYLGEKYMRGHAYFDFTAYCLGGIEMKKAPEKRVGAEGCTWEEAVAADQQNPYVVRENQVFQYMIQTEVTPNQLQLFQVQDMLEPCLTIDNTSMVTVNNDVGQDVTEQFDIQIEGQKVTCKAKAGYLSQEAFTNNQLYTFAIKVHQKADADMASYLGEDGYNFFIPNCASMTYQRTNGTGETKTTDTVWVKTSIVPELELQKSISQYEWEVGDELEYTVRVTQTRENACAVNAIVEDIGIPSCLQLLEGQYALETAAEGCTLERAGENGWQVHCPMLHYNESILVTYRCLAVEESDGQEWINTVSATAENYIDAKTGEAKEAKDLAEVWINSPELEIDKTADQYEWQVGQEVQYRVTVKNTAPGTIAREVNVTDIGLPAGLVLAQGAGSVEIVDALQQVEYPIPDHKTGQVYEQRAADTSLKADAAGFAFYCSYLPYSRPVTILFHCMATEEANGHESVNQASAVAVNAQETKSDDAEVYVNSGDFWIEKLADHYEWQLGEEVEYTVTIENQAAGSIARNVTVWDTQLPQGLTLLSPDAVTIEGIPESITQPTAGTVDVPNQINPEFYGETEQKMVGYEFLPEGSGWKLNISDLPAGVPVTIRFQCSVTEEANGMESINAANVQAENAPPKSDDAEIYVNTAALSIDKDFLNPYLETGDGREVNEFRVGEQILYQVVVDNLQKGSIARNVVVRDLSLPEGLQLSEAQDGLVVSGIPQTILNPVGGTDDAGNELNPENYNEVVEKEVIYQLNRDGNGWILTISDLPYHTPVTISFVCTVQEELNGWEVVNTADAYAQNALQVKDSSKIWVNSPVLKVEKKADKPSYKYGDLATYRIVLTQEQPGCVARNVVLQDVFQTEGVRLLKDSVVLLDQDGNLVDGAVEANENNSFTLYTGRNLIKQQGYSIFDADRGGVSEQVLYNPLDLRLNQQLIIEYQAAVIDESLAGKTVQNVATVQSQEKSEASDEETVEIHSPILEIVKQSDKKEYKEGETGYYQLTVRQLREDVRADNVIIEDVMMDERAVVQKDSILIKKNGQILENVELGASERGFRILTGTSLTDADKLEVFYKVVFENVPEDGMTVVNTAKASGDLTPEVITEMEVYVKKQPEASPTPEMTPAPEATATPKPTTTAVPNPTQTPSPRPTAASCPQNTKIPTKAPTGTVYGSSNGNNSGGTSGTYGGYQSGTTAGNAKTGDTRPFDKMAKLGVAGILLLLCGIWYYWRSKKGRGGF